MLMVNLGCGGTWHADWLNLDALPRSSQVQPCDVRNAIPLASSSCDVVYHSHLLEHLERSAGERLMRECHRVLKPEGICRVAVPDLERIVRAYVQALDSAPVEADSFEYEWAMIELYDQTVRQMPGGEMGLAMRTATPEQRRHVESRVGPPPTVTAAAKQARLQRFTRERLLAAASRRSTLAKHWLEESVLRLVGGEESRDELRLGRFRHSGEIHYWMYDRYSLSRLFQRVGFHEIKVCSANESLIPLFETFCLEVLDGRVRKPDSLFVESLRPAV